MDTKSYLKQIGRFDRQIQNKLSEINQINTMVCGVTVSNAEGDHVKASGNKDKIGNIVSRLVDMEHEVDVLIEKRCEIIEQIEKIEDTDQYDMLAQIYILKKELKVVAVEKRMSYSHAKRLHGQAVDEFEKLYGEKYLKIS